MATVDLQNAHVNGSNTRAASYFYEHPGGLALVFTRSWHSNVVDVATFDGVPLTELQRVSHGDVEGCVFKIEGEARSGDIVIIAADGTTYKPSILVPVGENVDIRAIQVVTESDNGPISGSVDSEIGDLVLQSVIWRNSDRDVSGFGSGQTLVLSDDSPTRMVLSEKAGEELSTTMSTEYSAYSGDFVSFLISLEGPPAAAPTERRVIVDTDLTATRDYDSLGAALDGEAKDLVALNRALVIECRASSGLADTAGIVGQSNTRVEGFITSALNTLTIEVAAGHRHSGVWDATKYRLEPAGGGYAGLRVGSQYTTVDGLQVDNINRTVDHAVLGIYVRSSNVEVRNCIARDAAGEGSTAHRIGFRADTVDECYFRNCVAYAMNAGSNSLTSGFLTAEQTAGQRIYIENCTVHDCRIGYYHHSTNVEVGNTTVKNCVATDSWTSDFFQGMHADSSNNISSDETAPGASSLVNQVATDLFTDPANGNFNLKAGSAAINAGADLSEFFTTDIRGYSRPAGAGWDIGAFEFGAAPPGRLRFDFSSLQTGAGVPAGLSWLRSTGNEVVSVLEDMEYLDGKALRLYGTDSDFRALGIDAVEVPWGTDFDIVWRARNIAEELEYSWSAGAMAEFAPGEGVSGRFILGVDYDRSDPPDGAIQISRSGESTDNWFYLGSGSTTSSGGGVQSAPNKLGVGQWNWYRLRKQGNSYKMAASGNLEDIELDAQGEPNGGWDYTSTYDWNPAGRPATSPVGFAFWRPQDWNDTEYDFFEVAWGHENYAETDTDPDPGLEQEPPVRVLCLGDSVTAGYPGSHAGNSYRWPLYDRLNSNGGYGTGPAQVSFVGLYYGLNDGLEPTVGWAAWPQADSQHAGYAGESTSQLAGHVQSLVATHDADVILYFGAFISQGSVTEQDFRDLIDNARAAKADIKILFGKAYYGTPFSEAETDQYNARLATVVAEKQSETSPLHIVDMADGWDPEVHGGGYDGNAEGRYPSEPGNALLAERWAEALFEHFRVGPGRYARPVGDLELGAWTPSEGDALYPMLNSRVADDVTHVRAMVASTCRMRLSSALLPQDAGRSLLYRARGTGTLKVRLYQGTTLVAEREHTGLDPSTFTELEMELTTGELAALTDGAELFVELEATEG